MAAECTLARLVLSRDRIDVVGEKFLGSGYVNLAFVFLHQLLPAFVASIGAQAAVS